MSYQVLTKKWRPQLFEEIVGQAHIIRILKNAVSLGRISHAYLFSGQRGVGKTSTARILAKALNCEKGPTPSPCNQCSICRQIIRGDCLDVLEIDGASNRGIDEVRELREKVRFSPVKAKFKVYIIDEVHMLTNPAFNALLKTLEEPPSYVVFIFATTNPHKLPQTITSRCQHFEFRGISASDILLRLKQIVEKEKIDIREEALRLIAEAAENSMRDAEKILDQTTSYAEKKITEEDIADILGMVEKKYLFQLTENLAHKATLSNIKLLNQLLKEGKSAEWFISGWRKWFRDLIIIKVGGNEDSPLLLNLDERGRLEKQASYFDLNQLIYFIDLLSEFKQKITSSFESQIHLELLMIQLFSFSAGIDNLNLKEPELSAIYQKILDLEKRLTSKSPPLKGKKEDEEKISFRKDSEEEKFKKILAKAMDIFEAEIVHNTGR
ncbi:MAG: DNA polymerase III subunit gamma/tau [Candidatus Aerophobetes bacterium]|nr:DNA polymerase III subunit gamma/tau [Candidatus Aerophobetes bacterium]